MKRNSLKNFLAFALAVLLSVSSFAAGVFTTSAAPVYGDVNNDGKVDSGDALVLLQIAVGLLENTEEIVAFGDLDLNVEINSADALLILKKAVGEAISLVDFSLNTKDKTVGVGSELQAEAVDFNPRIADNTQVQWYSSDTKVATVDKNGKIKALKDGKTTITAKSTDGSEIEKSFVLTVLPLISTVKVDKTELTLTQGSKYTLKLTITPSNAFNKTMKWTTSNASIATVDANGVVRAERIGTATITGKTTDGTNKSVTCKITVIAMKMSYVSQLPKYPTGCEAASCCMLLRYYGYQINIDEMIDAIPRKNLYKKNGKMYGPDINEMFVGDPRCTYTSSTPGYGVFSPAVTKSLQKVIDSRGGAHTAYKLSGCTFEELLGHIRTGSPAIVWATYKMQNPTNKNAWYIETTGKYFEYPRGTHVMILSGFSSTHVTTVDPYGNGVLTFDINTFKDRWELLGRQAIIIARNK